ncbi:MAG: cupin domain-containing protein [Gammaproteobacteria bacterium]|nr:cupin domain-containing protein [Gammaproteobacteria bacterium]
MNKLTRYNDISTYTTKDGSYIKELMHPATHSSRQQSLAEATIPINTETVLHKHINSEELYHITDGKGLMTLGSSSFEVIRGDTICIPPNTAHKIKNIGTTELKILCCCAPAYSHKDTILI